MMVHTMKSLQRHKDGILKLELEHDDRAVITDDQHVKTVNARLLEALKMLRQTGERDLRPESCCGPTKLAAIKQADAAIKAATEG